MNVKPSPMTIHDYCVAWDRKEIRVNRDYQRSPKVWPPAARAYLIESIVKQFPIPKLSLHQQVDPKTKTPFKEIVDGQQRTMAIVDFYHGEYRLSSTIEEPTLRNKAFDQLDDDDRQAFLDYSLDIDLFLATSSAEVRESFRRMNSYTIPLNPEEQRHARWQGEFKWFVNHLGNVVNETLLSVGVFTEKQLIRMQDAKLFAEIVHSAIEGIQTTKQKQLNDLYKSFDKDFPAKPWIGKAIEGSIEQIASWPAIHDSNLMKPYNVYALILGLMHIRKPLTPLNGIFQSAGKKLVGDQYLLANLTALDEALEAGEDAVQYTEFVAATRGSTNVKEQRETRFRWLCQALTQKAL